MRIRSAPWLGTERRTTALAVMAAWGLSALADPPAPETQPPMPLPEQLVVAWEKAGARVGWLPVRQLDGADFREETFGQPGDVPAFLFGGWDEGRLKNLPDPGTPFGLTLFGYDFTDTALKELASFSNL